MNPFGTRLCLAAALLLGSCGVAEAPSPEAGVTAIETPPLVVIEVLEDPGPDPSIPWRLTEGHEGISIGRVTPDGAGAPGSPTQALLAEALDAGMLIALVESGTLPGELERDHIQIWSDSSGAPRSLPPEIAAAIPDSSWSHPVQRQVILRDLFDLYLPDLTLITLSHPEPSLLRHVARFWTEPDVLADRNVILWCPGSAPDERGWVLLAGPSVNGEIPLGLTPLNLLSTLEMLLGLDWESAIPARVPCVGILLEPVP